MLFLLCKIMKYGRISFVTLAYYLKETQRQLWVEQIGKPCCHEVIFLPDDTGISDSLKLPTARTCLKKAFCKAGMIFQTRSNLYIFI